MSLGGHSGQTSIQSSPALFQYYTLYIGIGQHNWGVQGFRGFILISHCPKITHWGSQISLICHILPGAVHGAVLLLFFHTTHIVYASISYDMSTREWCITTLLIHNNIKTCFGGDLTKKKRNIVVVLNLVFYFFLQNQNWPTDASDNFLACITITSLIKCQTLNSTLSFW